MRPGLPRFVVCEDGHEYTERFARLLGGVLHASSGPATLPTRWARPARGTAGLLLDLDFRRAPPERLVDESGASSPAAALPEETRRRLAEVQGDPHPARAAGGRCHPAGAAVRGHRGPGAGHLPRTDPGPSHRRLVPDRPPRDRAPPHPARHPRRMKMLRPLTLSDSISLPPPQASRLCASAVFCFSSSPSSPPARPRPSPAPSTRARRSTSASARAATARAAKAAAARRWRCRRLPRARDRQTLLEIIEDGIDGTEMPDARLHRGEAAPGGATGCRSWAARPPEKCPAMPGARPGALLRQGPAAPSATPSAGRAARRHRPHRHRPAAGRRLPARALTDPEAGLPDELLALPRRRQHHRELPAGAGWCTPTGEELTGVRVNEDTFSIQIRDVEQPHALVLEEPS